MTVVVPLRLLNRGETVNKRRILKAIIIGSLLGLNVAQAKPAQPMAMPPTTVETAIAQEKMWQPTISLIGSLAAQNGVTLRSEIPGRVVQIYFKSGSVVKQGTPLVQLNPDILKAQLEKAIAQFNLDQTNFQRAQTMFQKHFVSQADLDASKATLNVSKAAVDDFQAQLAQTLIRAPFDGKVGISRISLGDYLTAGQAIADFQATDIMLVNFDIAENYLPQLQVKNLITITSPALSKPYTGQITAVNSSVDPNTRMLEIQAEIPNTDHHLIPGMFVEIHLLLGTPQSTIVIPQTAILYSPEENSVYRVIDNKAVKTTVTLGEKLSNNEIIILSGLKKGDAVIIGPQVKVHEGSMVSPVNSAHEKDKK